MGEVGSRESFQDQGVEYEQYTPAKRNVPWSPPDIGEAEKQAAKAIIDSGWLTQGNETERFEEELAAYIGCKHAIVVNNGTSALIAALLAHGIGHGDEVIVPSYTFIATVNAVSAVGATPILADSDPKTFNTTPELVAPLITEKTKAIMPVDVAGMPIDLEGFTKLAKDHNFILIEDAAEALGAEYQGKRIGSFDHTAIFSFHMAKLASTVEGGCIATQDDGIAEKCRQIRNHGMAGKYQYATFGLNFRTTDIQSAIGRVQLSKLDTYLTRRSRLAAIYKQVIGDLAHYQHVPDYASVHPYMIFMVLVEPEKRDAIIAYLNEHGVGTRICWPATHEQPYHSTLFTGSYPGAEELSARSIALPMGNALTEDDVEYVANVLVRAIEEVKP